MRLPDRSSLQNTDHLSLLDHDIREYHSLEASGYSFYYRDRLKAVMEEVSRRIPAGDWVIDLGCSQANLALLLAEKGYQVIAADLRIHPLTYARLKYEKGKFYPLVCNTEKIPLQKKISCVIAGEIVEHMAYPENLLTECRKILEPGGFLILTTPNGRFFANRLPTFSQIKDRQTLVKQQFEPDEEGHLFLFTEKELADLVKAQGFEILSVSYRRSIFFASRKIFGLMKKTVGMPALIGLERLSGRLPGWNQISCEAMMMVVKERG